MLNDNFFHDFIASLFAKFKGFTGSRGWRRTIALILVLGNMVTSSGMTVLKEVNDSLEPDTTIEETEATAQEETEATEPLTDETTGEVTGETTAEATETSSEATTSEETTADETTATEETTTAVTETELTTKTFEGDGYTVTASYGPETGISEDCELIASEIVEGNTYDEYMDLTAEALSDVEINRVRFFDICLMKDGVEYEPLEGTSVSVKIMLSESLEDEVNVVHISDDSEATVVNTLDVQDAENGDGTEVTFDADGFSAYAIVAGPTAGNSAANWHRIQDMTEFAAHVNEIYIGSNSTNYYMTNSDLVFSGTRSGIVRSLSTSANCPTTDAAPYVFESTGTANQYYIYTVVSGTPKYIRQSGNSLSLVTNLSSATKFTVGCSNAQFTALGSSYYINKQGGTNGQTFAAYDQNNADSKLTFWWYDSTAVVEDPYDLDGCTYGLISYNGGVSGKGLMTDSTHMNSLDALTLPVLTKESNHSDKIFVPNNSDIPMWTFEWKEDDKYYLLTEINGAAKYLHIDTNGLSISSTPQAIQVVPGTGDNAGKISLVADGKALEYSGDPSLGFSIISSSVNSSNKWLNLVELAELTNQYVLPYSARKISVSDTSDFQLHNGDRVIVYTRVWDESQKKYRFYAVDHDGSLYECYEDGDEIQWLDDRINTLLWDLTIYYNDEGKENYYYELYNEYSEKYIRPNPSSSEALGDDIIGINMNGRRLNKYYTPIVAWDDDNYAYAGIRTDMSDPNHMKIISYPYTETVPSSESTDFYFAIIKETTYEDQLHPVATVDNTKYGITMKIIDFDALSAIGQTGEQSTFLGSSEGGLNADPQQGLLSTKLGNDGYPTVMQGANQGHSLVELYDPSKTREVNHLFIQSIYNTSGYFVYDSTQNFATLANDNDNDFTVYQELGTADSKQAITMQHGQFLPFDDITAGVYSSLNPENIYSALQERLPSSNPRKYEHLHLAAKNPNYHFGLELSTSFVQTPDGHDDWGHDIIYEFTGDDDFWLYVDGELVIDLGGIHSALFGSINYSTGEVKVQTKGRQGTPQTGDITVTSLYDIFKANYQARGLSEQDINTKLNEIFEQNSAGQYVFKEYTPHDMKIFYMERGAGASNLLMRFNQSSVKPGTVILSKDLTGVEDVERFNAEFPYQIWYKDKDDEPFKRLTDSYQHIYVVYRGTDEDVKYKHEYYIDGQLYNDVFFLEPGEACEIKLPDETIEYYIVECGVDKDVFENVYANETLLPSATPTPCVDGYTRYDFATEAASAKTRTSVKYVNEVDQDALRTLTFKKILWDEQGGALLTNDTTPFNFRLYLATEHETYNELELANMYTYHVKDPDGVYCKWDSATQSFVPIRAGVTDYSELTDQEKRLARFTTSMYGSISKIPAFYTVEVRELLAGTKYKVEERYEEIPDGYSRYKYMIYDDVTNTSDYLETSKDTETPSTIIAGEDPYVEVHNIKGYGIRIYKEWTDEQFVSERDNTYFAVYKDDASTGNEVLVNDTVYQLKFKKNTLYWYFETLDAGLTLQDYHVREVVVEDPVVDTTTGQVTSYTSITPAAEGDEITLNSKLKGENISYAGSYTVDYDDNPDIINNMRIENIVNKRDGITINKVYRASDGNLYPIAGARFELRDDEGTLIGTFESDDDGFVTIAYLRKGIDYTLSEIKSPSGYTGIKKPVTIRMNNDGTITVTPDPSTASIDKDRFTYVKGPTDPSVTIINIRYDFTISKKDRLTNEPVEGVEFALHKQKTVGGVTVVDFQPIPGYEHLVTDSNGIVPRINSTLAPGTYELRETGTPTTHQGLNYYILFTVTETGDIRLNATHPEVMVDEHVEEDRVLYTLLIYNYPVQAGLIVSKQIEGNFANMDDVFQMTVELKTSANQPYTGTVYYKKNNGTQQEVVLTASDNGIINFELGHGDNIVFTNLDDGTKFKVTENPGTYLSKGYRDGKFTGNTGVVTGNTTDHSRVLFINSRAGLIPTGVDSDIDVSAGIILAISAGFAITLILSRKRRREDC